MPDASLLEDLAESSMKATSDARSLLVAGVSSADRTLAVHELIAFALPVLVILAGGALLCRVRALLRVRRGAFRTSATSKKFDSAATTRHAPSVHPYYALCDAARDAHLARARRRKGLDDSAIANEREERIRARFRVRSGSLRGARTRVYTYTRPAAPAH